MIAILNYGLGNVKAFADVYKSLNIPAAIVTKGDGLKDAGKLILPGVGSFDTAMRRLERSGMRPMLDELVRHRRLPVLGVCVGMQMLARSSEEGSLPGLGWVDGDVRRFNLLPQTRSMRLPHMGWNTIRTQQANALLKGLDPDARFYFLHSYFFKASREADIMAVTDYGGEFTCVINSENIYGVQFHPEKSHRWGMQLLKNFAEI